MLAHSHWVVASVSNWASLILREPSATAFVRPPRVGQMVPPNAVQLSFRDFDRLATTNSLSIRSQPWEWRTTKVYIFLQASRHAR